MEPSERKQWPQTPETTTKLEGAGTSVTRQGICSKLQLRFGVKEFGEEFDSQHFGCAVGKCPGGPGGTFVEAIRIGGYLFDPVAKISIVNNASYILWSAAIMFIAGFGVSLQFMLGIQFWRRS